MATVLITLDDKKNKTTMDVEFNPPLTDDHTEAQTLALRLISYLGGRCLSADRQRMKIEHDQVPAHWLYVPTGEAGCESG